MKLFGVDGELSGLTTGGAYGHRVGRSLSFAYIKPEQNVKGRQVIVETSLGERKAHVEMMPAYDPKNEKLRG